MLAEAADFPPQLNGRQAFLSQLFHCGVEAVRGQRSVRTSLISEPVSNPTKIIALGKAAVSMFQGLPQEWQKSIPALLITKYGHAAGAGFSPQASLMETGHPMPDASSLAAGERLLSFVAESVAEDRLLVLLSGGASSLVEKLQPDVTAAALEDLTRRALSDGACIADINRLRCGISAIKGGRLLSHFNGQRVDVLAISDVQGDSISVIGSGIADAPAGAAFAYNCRIVASNSIARKTIAEAVLSAGLELVVNEETLYGDVCQIAEQIAGTVCSGPRGVYLFGGEPTVVLPENPGLGGRNQALALELARLHQGKCAVYGLAAGTDGTDGPTCAAGGFWSGQTFRVKLGAEAALRTADTGSFLAKSGYQFVTGPTGTNVMDLVIVLRG